ncbi:putative receptor binding protein [Lactococcus phage ASCC506]|uniref:Putative receptor binding protein n=6 Tax=Skunavirus ASCC273 TaxID=1165135 RepID=H9EF65_9CAUD|nr:putative receptor binding protein [Lactococcus phage ASCC395]AFE87499.1 putative receptor binding protein [Lactococcus phage ASCC397]AFE87558.1 putative receptor binding protein [Lactococcus phage ASCC406]AFE87675.1 putative receptor binding protein [Lactococcus phage ASCC460]AFE87734.1 putative receptor binding protein [Lactococcus phage ASCC476]AFE87907.1 putative receptor binding protein [Lactococcus phage ASCC506]
MTIKNFTFFSPNGTEFPVGSNNDGKLYMMLTGMDYGTIRRKDWTSPLNTALNVQYTNTSIIAGGRYFELLNETVALKANSTNYIHANIDLTQTANPVSLSAETVDNSNNVDLNNRSGVLKVLIDIRTTNGLGVISDKAPDNITYLDKAVINSVSTTYGSLEIGNGITLIWQKKADIVEIKWIGRLTEINAGQTFAVKAPFQIIPDKTKELVGHFANTTNSFHIDLETDGTFRWWGVSGANGYIRGTSVYFIK